MPPTGTYADSDARVDDSGHVVILTSRDYASGGSLDHRVNIVADPDGPVYAAIMATQPLRYLPNVYMAPTFAPPRFLWNVIENCSFNSGGYIAGTIGQLKPTAHRRFSGGAPTFNVGDLGIIEGPTLLDFATGAQLAKIAGSLPMLAPWQFQSYVFGQGSNGARTDDVEQWSLDGGLVDLVNYGYDPNHAAGALGTDGTDMVWLEAHGPPSDAGLWSTADYWTSPYVTAPANLQSRRLTSESPTALLGNPIAVGCGMAAYAVIGLGLRIIRVSDGAWWLLLSTGSPDWQQALAITCTEVFVTIGFAGPTITMARIAIDSLGPPMAAN